MLSTFGTYGVVAASLLAIFYKVVFFPLTIWKTKTPRILKILLKNNRKMKEIALSHTELLLNYSN